MTIDKETIAEVINSVICSINDGRPTEKSIELNFSDYLIGSSAVLDSLDLFMFIVDFEAQLKTVGLDANVMGIIERAVNKGEDVTLGDIVNSL